jgi:hypothetical protein
MDMIVFAGPSLARVKPFDMGEIVLRPPAACGDIARAAAQQPAAIGLIDGFFETTASPWHKEILWALARNIAVFGSSSMGALRAVELHLFGMIGVGQVFAAYRGGLIEDDDEVSILHGPKETGYVHITEALVNVRASLAKACEHNILGAGEAAALIEGAKDLFYKDRTWDRILEAGRGRIDESRLVRLAEWLPEDQVDIKGQDAKELIQTMVAWTPGCMPGKTIEFPATAYWQQLLSRISRNSFDRPERELPSGP